MTRDDIIRMAEEAEVPVNKAIERLVALVEIHAAAKEREWMQETNKRLIAEAVAAEREACAKVCDAYDDGRYANMAGLCADAIRARGRA